ncbi:MAG: hypothetical protein ACREN8_06935 [Candidatus Dormibacteraceae bacterium]
MSLLAPPVGDISRTDIDKNTAINQASQAANNAIIKPAPAAPAKQADTAPPAPSTKATVDQKPVVAQPTVQGQCSRVRTGIRQGTGNGATRRRRVRNDGATLALQDVKQAARTCANQVAVLRLEEAGDD